VLTFWEKKDEKGVRFGDKTTCLEALGLLLPILSFPEFYKNSTVITKVDCLGVVFGMWNKHSAGDKCASVIIKSIKSKSFISLNRYDTYFIFV
jgi:hypothetical protein